MESALESTDDENDCIVCYNPCKTRAKCCKNSLCRDCVLKWWEYKRQCPYCRKGMLDLDLWLRKYKNDSKSLHDDFEPENLIDTNFLRFSGIQPRFDQNSISFPFSSHQPSGSTVFSRAPSLSIVYSINESGEQTSVSFRGMNTEDPPGLDVQTATRIVRDALPHIMMDYNILLSQGRK